MGALKQQVAPFGIRTTIINPGFFRTGLASPESLVWPELSIDDYAERSATQRQWWQSQDGQQAGDPDKFAVLPPRPRYNPFTMRVSSSSHAASFPSTTLETSPVATATT